MRLPGLKWPCWSDRVNFLDPCRLAYRILRNKVVESEPLRQRLGLTLFAITTALLVGLTYLFSRLEILDSLPLWFTGICTLAVAFQLIKIARLLYGRSAEHIVRGKGEFVLYLRPFGADILREEEEREVVYFRLLRLAQSVVPAETSEQVVVRTLRRSGPVVALQRPGEVLPGLGAARLRVGAGWQDEIKHLIRRARLVVLVGAPSPGVHWELVTVLREVDPRRLLILLGFNKSWFDAQEFRQLLETVHVVRPKVPLDIPYGVSVLAFDEQWELCLFGPSAQAPIIEKPPARWERMFTLPEVWKAAKMQGYLLSAMRKVPEAETGLRFGDLFTVRRWRFYLL